MSRPDLSNRFVFDDPRYEQLAIEGEAQYKLGTPFNHMAFDNFLPEDIAEAMWQEFPKAQDIEWHNYNRPAERKLALYHGEWQGQVDPVFREFAY